MAWREHMKCHGGKEYALQQKALETAYETVIEDLAARCDYGKDSPTERALDILEQRYSELRLLDIQEKS